VLALQVELCSPRLIASRAEARRRPPSGFRPGFWPQGQSNYSTPLIRLPRFAQRSAKPSWPDAERRGVELSPWPASWRRSVSGSGSARSPSHTHWGDRGENRAPSCRVADRMSLYERALKRMEALAAASAQGDTPWGPDRDLVSRETAADAVMDVFATLDALRQGVELPPDRIEHTLGMLMLIREYVVPLPSPSGEEDLLLQDDLEQLAADLRRARRDFGLPS
jgi:hypothetical protein